MNTSKMQQWMRLSYSVSTSTRYLTSDLCQHVHPRFPNPLSPRPMPTRSPTFPKPLSVFIISETDTHPKALLRTTSGRRQPVPLLLGIPSSISYSYVHFHFSVSPSVFSVRLLLTL